ncbi:hypothetical protein AHAS_Ahas17G0157300 [Arachis hypogaea]
MSRNRDKKSLLDFDPELERTFRRRLQQARLYKAAKSNMDHNNATNANMANLNENEQPRRVFGSCTAPNADFHGKSIVVPPIAANNFELKPQLVTLVQQNCQYHGLSQEDPNQFITDFLQICDTVKTNGVNLEVYRLIFFPFAVKDRVKLWLDSQPKESLDTWDKVVTGFLTKFFPPQKLTKLRAEVQTFRQKDGETLYEAWERFKLPTRQCPPDMFSRWTHLDIFYKGLCEMSKMRLDNSACTSLQMKKTSEETTELIELLKPPLVTINKIPPNIKPKFGVGKASSTKEEVPKKKKVPRGWRNKKIPTEDFSPRMKVVFTTCPILPHTVNRILSLEHIELINGSTGKKFTVRGEELSPYDPPP